MALPAGLLQSALYGILLLSTQASAHGIATALVRFPGGTFFKGYNPSYQYENPQPLVVGWSTPDDLQNTFIPPDKYTHPDIACHLAAKPAALHAPVSAGDVLSIQWTPWPTSHKGPVLDYLAKCDTVCDSPTLNKTALKFFKIAEAGLINLAQDLWAGNLLANNNNSWLVKIPTGIQPGNYVLRHEIIALHAAGQLGGAQNYPFCFSLAISGNGTDVPEGTEATRLYRPDHPGIKFDLFSKFETYPIPGPSLYSHALPVSQTKAGAIMATAPGVSGLTAAPPKPTPVVVPSKAAPPAPSAAITPVVPVPIVSVGPGGGNPVVVYSTTLVTTKVWVTEKARVTVTTTKRG